ncbi:MAG: DUF1707 domain-containing protein [Rhodococcus sp. (in: high G+C Gram-positive bacteria)]
MDPSDPRARDLRVSDAEREHVGGLLQRAVGHGMLSLGEFSERMDSVLAAKTRGELNAVLIDLPGMSIAGQTPDRAPVPPPAPQAPAHPTEVSPADIRATMSTVTRSGSWRAPPAIRIASKMATVTLDFTSAVLSSPVVRIDVDDYCSTITLVVPDGASVDFGGLVLIGGSAKNRLGSRPVQGALHVSVHGRVRFGSVTAKHSLGTAIRRMFG